MQVLFHSARTVPWLQESDKSASAGILAPAEADVALSVVVLDLPKQTRLVRIFSSGDA